MNRRYLVIIKSHVTLNFFDFASYSKCLISFPILVKKYFAKMTPGGYIKGEGRI